MALFFGYVDKFNKVMTELKQLKKWVTENFQKKTEYRLNTVMTWYYSSAGGTPKSVEGNAFPMTPVSADTKIRILCHSFDNDGIVPDDTVKVEYRLYYVTKARTQGSELLGTVTLGKADRHYSWMWSIPVNKDFYVSDTITDLQRNSVHTVGYIYPTITNIPAGNEGCITVAFFEPVK